MNKNKIKIFARKLKRNLLFSSAWAIALITVITVNISTKETITFVGVSDSSEKIINSKYAVIVRSINVIPGEVVSKGRLLVELERTDLTQSILEVKSELDEVLHQIDLNIEIIEKVNKQEDEKHFLITKKESLEQKIELLEREQEELFIYSEFEGHIGSVNFKSGENVAPFSSILTLHSKKPRFVKGYLHEGVSKKNLENSSVMVSAITSQEEVKAIITHVGTKIVELPPRLRRISSEPIYGREVTIRLPLNNKLLMGEKVFLKLLEGKHPNLRKISQSHKEPKDYSINQINFDFASLDEKKFEPSGVTYIEELNQFLIISDDTKNNMPKLFLMNRNGSVSNKKVLVKGIKKIKDLESILKIDENNFLLLSSLSPGKNGKVGKHESKLLWIKRQGTNFTLYKQTNLYKFLKKQNSIKFTSLNVEGMGLLGDDLLLGIRDIKTKDSKRINLISISNYKNLFSKKKRNNSVVRNFEKLDLIIKSIVGREYGISDLTIKDNIAYLTLASNETTFGGISLFVDMSGMKVLEQRNYEVARPEGICLTDKDEIITVFEMPNNKNGFYSEM